MNSMTRKRREAPEATEPKSTRLGVTVVALEAIDKERDPPAHDEQRDDAVTEHAEIAVETGDRIPENALQLELARDQAEGFDAADHQSHQYRNRCDGEIVEKFAHRIAIRPPISAKHQHAVGGVNERHAGGKQRRKNQQRPT